MSDATPTPATTAPDPVPEDNPYSHELFAEFDAVVEKMKAHRPDDIIGAWHRLATQVQQTRYPQLIVMDDNTIICPYCKEEIEVDEYGWLEGLRFHDWDTTSYPLELTIPEDGGEWIISAANDQNFAQWETLHCQHDCGGAVDIPENIHVEFT